MARPRAFDLSVATDQALQLFWRKGYEGTTLDDLTSAMGINRPSLYAAFGSKAALFRRALDRYLVGQGASAMAALEAGTSREGVHRLMRFYADAAGVPNQPSGCLLINGGLVGGAEGQQICDVLAERRRFSETTLVSFLEKAKKRGDLGEDEKPSDWARYVWTVCHGLSVQAVGGATRAQLRKITDLAMRAWPTP